MAAARAGARRPPAGLAHRPRDGASPWIGRRHPNRLMRAGGDPAPTRSAADPAGKGGRAWGLMAQLYSVRLAGRGASGTSPTSATLPPWGGARCGLPSGQPRARRRGHQSHRAIAVPAGDPPVPRPAVRPPGGHPRDRVPVGEQREAVSDARSQVATSNRMPRRIDRDAAWAAKREALETVFAAPRSAARQAALDAYVAREGRPLVDFALWCALEEHFAATLGGGRAPGRGVRHLLATGGGAAGAARRSRRIPRVAAVVRG